MRNRNRDTSLSKRNKHQNLTQMTDLGLDRLVSRNYYHITLCSNFIKSVPSKSYEGALLQCTQMIKKETKCS